jgi:NTE family protein
MQTGQALASLAGKPGVDTGQRVLELLEKLTKGKKIGETEIPFRCNAVDLFSGREIVFNSGPLAKAMRASMSLPVFFEPFMYNGMCLVDGGLFDNVPITLARNEDFKRVLAVDVNRFSVMGPEDLRNGPNVIFRSIECALRPQDEKKAQADLIINIAVAAEFFSFFKKKELIKLGETAFDENLNGLKNFFG